MTNNNTTNGSSTTVSSTKKEEIPPGSNGLNEVHNFEDLKMLVEKQNETIKSQRSEIESLRKSFEKNMNLTQDFQSELSEIRKNWQSLSENANKNGNNPVQQSNKTLQLLEELLDNMIPISVSDGSRPTLSSHDLN